MLKWALIWTAILYVQPILAVDSTQNTVAASECLQCANGNTGKTAMDALIRFSQEMNSITDGALDIEVISDNMGYSERCEKFVGDGEVNHWGEIVNKELSKGKYSTLLFEGPKDIELYCPNFQRLKIKNRKAVFMLIITAMTHHESSCDFRAKTTGTNGTASGLLQLHKGREGRYSSGCRNGDASSAERSLICGLSMLNDQTIGRGERLFSSASYWEVLRPRGRSKKAKKIMTAIAKFPACAVAKRNAAARVAQR